MNEKLKQIKEENIVIFIYFIILFTYLYANNIETNYIKYGNEEDKEKYRLLLYIIFGISFIISLYYTIENFKDLKKYDTKETYKLKQLSAIANTLIVLATAIYLYIIYKDKDINLEISPWFRKNFTFFSFLVNFF